MSAFAAVDIICEKRDGHRLSDEQIKWFVDAFMNGYVANEQMSALAMAIVLNGMDSAEIVAWTNAMIDSGERSDLGDLRRRSVDKHSTGGVGDKITLILVPVMMACGAVVPQVSGRGLGHTGGTLDKLESIPGWQSRTSQQQWLQQLADVGGAITAAGAGLAPVDAKLYALRDVTGTVESIPLIASSIMSKKIASGARSLVLDVKVGNGAFMQSVDDARELASTMVRLGNDAGVRTRALLTAMDVPLGLAVGNAIEVQESVDALAGGGPRDVVELTMTLAREMLELAGIDADPERVLADGRAMDAWRRLVTAQGGDPDARLPQARHRHDIRAERNGVVRLQARGVGVAAWRLGAGRARQEDSVSHTAGVQLRVRPGDDVRSGDVIATVLTDDEARIPAGIEAVAGAITVEGPTMGRLPLVIERIVEEPR